MGMEEKLFVPNGRSKEEDISNVNFYDTLETELKLTNEQFNEIILLSAL